MSLIIASYLAGVLTALAPCILPLLPVIIGGSLVDEGHGRNWKRPLIITGSLALSVIAFTLLLKATTTLIGVPQAVWSVISGMLVILLGLGILFPHIWEQLMLRSGLYMRSNTLLQKAGAKDPGIVKDIVTGAALGPVFSSCSPTYAFIVAVALPRSFVEGFGYLLAYAIGLASILLAVAIIGKSLTRRLSILNSPKNYFRQVIGVAFISVGIFVLTGIDKRVQTFVLDKGWYDPIQSLEMKLR